MSERFEVVKNGPREYHKERRTGRVVTGTITTWDVVEVAACQLVSEHYTRREAREALARLIARTTEVAR